MAVGGSADRADERDDGERDGGRGRTARHDHEPSSHRTRCGRRRRRRGGGRASTNSRIETPRRRNAGKAGRRSGRSCRKRWAQSDRRADDEVDAEPGREQRAEHGERRDPRKAPAIGADRAGGRSRSTRAGCRSSRAGARSRGRRSGRRRARPRPRRAPGASLRPRRPAASRSPAASTPPASGAPAHRDANGSSGRRIRATRAATIGAATK